MMLGLAGIGYLAYRAWQQHQAQVAALSVPSGASPLDALTTGLQAGISAGTYDANALRMQAMRLSNSVGLPSGAMN